MEKIKGVKVSVTVQSAEGEAEVNLEEAIEVPVPAQEAEGENPPRLKSYTKAQIADLAQKAMDKLTSRFLRGLTALLLTLQLVAGVAFAEPTYIEEQTGFRHPTYKGGVIFKQATASVDCTTAAGTCSASNLIPAGATVLGVTIRVTTTMTGATTINIGDGTTATKWGTGIAVAAGTTTTSANFTSGNGNPTHYASATSVVLTAVGGGADFTAGVVRIMVNYLANEAPQAG